MCADAARARCEQDGVVAAIEAGKRRLDGSGRLVIRPSGTEPVIRVMGEGENSDLVDQRRRRDLRRADARPKRREPSEYA